MPCAGDARSGRLLSMLSLLVSYRSAPSRSGDSPSPAGRAGTGVLPGSRPAPRERTRPQSGRNGRTPGTRDLRREGTSVIALSIHSRGRAPHTWQQRLVSRDPQPCLRNLMASQPRDCPRPQLVQLLKHPMGHAPTHCEPAHHTTQIRERRPSPLFPSSSLTYLPSSRPDCGRQGGEGATSYGGLLAWLSSRRSGRQEGAPRAPSPSH